jgi:hydrogenase/urease accessory protein HupE
LSSVVALGLYWALPRGFVPNWIEPLAFVCELLAGALGFGLGIFMLVRRQWEAILWVVASGWVLYQQLVGH